MTKQKIMQIYDMILNKEKLTTSKLYSYGITKSDLEEMINTRKIDKIGEDEYTITSNESLYNLGVALTNNREYDRGIKYLEKYYELEKQNKEVKLVLILVYINRKQYQNIFPILDELLKTNNKKEQKDYNLILYLLSLVCPYPEKYQDKILNLTYDDILYNKSDIKTGDIDKQNQMRTKIMQNKLYQAEITFNTCLINTYTSKPEQNLIKKLLEDAQYMDKRRNETLEQYTREKSYKNIISLLDKKSQKMKLSLGDELIYKITKDIIRIQETRKIPKPQIFEAENIKTAIEGKNYYLALKLNGVKEKYSVDHNIKRTITMLLIDINKLISSILKEYKENKLKQQKTETNENSSTKSKILRK